MTIVAVVPQFSFDQWGALTLVGNAADSRRRA